jgi:hypothetical protein
MSSSGMWRHENLKSYKRKFCSDSDFDLDTDNFDDRDGDSGGNIDDGISENSLIMRSVPYLMPPIFFY